MKVYLDNAATTALDSDVIEEMLHYMKTDYGNPSSTHAYGRKTRAAVDLGRKKAAQFINAEPGEIVFTSGGTEADNMAIKCSVNDLGVRHIITSPIEHHAVLYPIEQLEKEGRVKMSLVKIDEQGNVDLEDLERLLSESNDKTLVSLMHANNEIGTLLPLKRVGEICEKYDAYLHSDTVQTIAHYTIDVKDINIHFLTCSAHKFHGPKGVGFLYVNSSVKVNPVFRGGGQERNLRAGTENVYGIMGLVKALELAYTNLDKHRAAIEDLRSYMLAKLESELPGTKVNGNPSETLYTVLNVALPKTDKAETLLFNLDIEGVSVSGGSACSSGSSIGSHVVAALRLAEGRPVVRFSFSKYNTKEEIDYTVKKLKEIYEMPVIA